MSDPTPGAAEPLEPERPAPEMPDPGPVAETDDTVRVPAEPEVAWDAPEPPRALSWETPAAAEPAPWTPPPAGVLSAAPVGWVAPPPEPVMTGEPGWVIASTGIRLVAWIVDGIVSGVVIGAGALVGVALLPGLRDNGTTAYLAYSVAATGFYFLYFVGFWTSEGKATPGMRLLKLQVANAADGKRLAIGPAVVRWLALGYIFSLVGLVPILSGFAGLAAFVWYIVLVATTASDAMHQGLHDRWAGSVVVRPQAAGSGAGRGVVTCLVVAAVVGLLFMALVIGIVVATLATYG